MVKEWRHILNLHCPNVMKQQILVVVADLRQILVHTLSVLFKFRKQPIRVYFFNRLHKLILIAGRQLELFADNFFMELQE